VNGTDTDIADLEDRLRSSLRTRAESTPVRLEAPSAVAVVYRIQPRRSGRTIGLVGGVAAAVLVVGAAVAFTRDGDDPMRTTADDPTVTDGSAAGLPPAPRLLIEGSSLWVDVDDAYPMPTDRELVVQSFRVAGRLDGPMIFLATYLPIAPSDTGLRFTMGDGDPVPVLGRTGLLSHPLGEAGPAVVTVELDDLSHVQVTAVGVTDADLVAFVDGLTDAGAHRWNAASLPAGMAEVPVAPDPTDGRTYSAYVALADAPVQPGEHPAGDIEVVLYQDGFEYRLLSAVGSTVGPIETRMIGGAPATIGSGETVLVGGLPAAFGAYSDHDFWVLLEPEPGRALQIRIQNRTRAEVDAILAQARLVDEATWQAAVMLPPKNTTET
jgi:hypothetical protein